MDLIHVPWTEIPVGPPWTRVQGGAVPSSELMLLGGSGDRSSPQRLKNGEG
jgi:hypothetical protein